mmetsp:Transcript_13886/g.36872  ORF Transcript_13886/g.36872 Transcript_13886/m.36872 type:complete len:216 (-) Transcript_13886:170-817(-)
MHNLKISANSVFSDSLSVRILAVVMLSLLKSKTSSLNSRRMCMLFSQRISEFFEAPQISPMKLGQLWGHSCLSMLTSTLFIWWIIVRSCIDDSSSFEREIILLTMKFLMPVRCPSGNIFHLVLMASSSAMSPKYLPCGNEDFSMIWSAACQQPGFSLSFMRISLAVARSGCLGSYAAATMPSRTATSKGWSSCNSLCPASATEVVMVASRARRQI